MLTHIYTMKAALPPVKWMQTLPESWPEAIENRWWFIFHSQRLFSLIYISVVIIQKLGYTY